MQFLKISCELQSPLGAYDDWSPDLGNLLERLWWDMHGTPGGSGLVTVQNLHHAPIPLAYANELNGDYTLAIEWQHPVPRADLARDWHWCCSSPQYRYARHTSQPIRRAWRPHRTRDRLLDFENSKWDSTAGDYKAVDIPAPGRCLTTPITWYAIGDRAGIESLLERCAAIGRNRKAGQGQLRRQYHNGRLTAWTVEAIAEDFSLYAPDGSFTRPVPLRLLPPEKLAGAQIRTWCWRPPGTLRELAEPCAMPSLVKEEIAKPATEQVWSA